MYPSQSLSGFNFFFRSIFENQGKGKVCPNRNWISQENSSLPALNPGYCSMKQLGVFLPPSLPGWDTSPSQVTFQDFCQVISKQFAGLFIDLGGERHCES